MQCETVKIQIDQLAPLTTTRPSLLSSLLVATPFAALANEALAVSDRGAEFSSPGGGAMSVEDVVEPPGGAGSAPVADGKEDPDIGATP